MQLAVLLGTIYILAEFDVIAMTTRRAARNGHDEPALADLPEDLLRV